jgi:KaiC/GvpD/RAD55 family RecA-like ATPase
MSLMNPGSGKGVFVYDALYASIAEGQNQRAE